MEKIRFEQFEARAAIREAEFDGFQDGGAAYKHEEGYRGQEY